MAETDSKHVSSPSLNFGVNTHFNGRDRTICERWVGWTSAAVWAVLGGTRFATDPQCLQVLDVHRHGCHTFVIALVVAVAGLVCIAIKAY